MPELPEVETVMRGLAPAFEGRRITNVDVRRPDLRFPFPPDMAKRLRGRLIKSLSRRSKYILIHLLDDLTLMVHLGMTGRFTLHGREGVERNLGEFYFENASGAAGDGPHDHVVIDLDDGTRAVYCDPRRFGMMDLVETGAIDQHRLMASLGIEPLGNELNAHFLKAGFAGKATSLKAALLDQKLIAGLGNIYVCEALHRAGLSPKRQAGSVARMRQGSERLEGLAGSIRTILLEAVEAGGSTLRDYAAPDGHQGGYQQVFAVYDRAGQACRRDGCGGMIERLVQSGRSTFYCRECQK